MTKTITYGCVNSFQLLTFTSERTRHSMPVREQRPKTISELNQHLQPGDFAWYVRSKSMRGMDPGLARIYFYRPEPGKARSPGALKIFCSISMSDFGANGDTATKESLVQLATESGFVLNEERGDPCAGVSDKLLVFRKK